MTNCLKFVFTIQKETTHYEQNCLPFQWEATPAEKISLLKVGTLNPGPAEPRYTVLANSVGPDHLAYEEAKLLDLH